MPITVTPPTTTLEDTPAVGVQHAEFEPDWIPERSVERQLRTVLARVVGASARCLVIGARGIGKSHTIQRLLNTDLQQLAGARACPFVIFCPLIRAITPRDTLLAIAAQAGNHTLLARARKHRYEQDQLRADLLSAMQQQAQVVLVIDEAHQLEEGALKAILDLLAEADHRAAQ
jgi:type II secretory pathway predicted ATPase ExeA